MLGVGIASFIPRNYLNEFIYFGVLSLAFVFFILCYRNYRWRLIFLFLSFFCLGLWRYAVSFPEITPQHVSYYNNQEISIIGRVINDPEIYSQKQKIVLEVSEVDTKAGIQGKILVYARIFPKFNYGEALLMFGKLSAPENFENFSYERFLGKQDIYSVSYYPQIQKINKRYENNLMHRIIGYKTRIRNIINRGLLEPEAGILRAMLLGEKYAVGDDIKELFARTGVSHILAISGMHIGVFIIIFLQIILMLGFNRRSSFYITSMILLFYIALIGWPPSATRAAIMGLVVMFALHVGRINKAINSLAISAVVLLLINPKFLRDDIGFQLSFLAIIAIIYIFPKLESGFQKFKIYQNRYIKNIIKIFLITISIQILTLPILLFNFNFFSLVSPVANIFIIWALPFILFFSMLAIILSLFLSNFTPIFFLPASFLIKYILIVLAEINKIPYSSWEVKNFNILGFFVFYLVVICVIILILARKNKKYAKIKRTDP